MRITIEEATPLDLSVQWQLHHAYFAQRGVAAWKSGEVPSLSTSNYPTARQQARFFAALVADLDERGVTRAGEPVWMMEVGCGSGRYAANFMRALEVEHPALLERTRYVITDYSPKNLDEVVGTPQIAAWIARGNMVAAVYDLNEPQRVALLGGGTLTSALTFIVTSYVCCVTRMKHLQHRSDGTWHQLLVEVHAEGDEDAGVTTAATYLEALLTDATRYNALKDLELHFSWGEVDPDTLFDDASGHMKMVAHIVDGLDEATLGYPYDYIDFMREVQPLMVEGGTIMTNDYGSPSGDKVAGRYERRPQNYGNSLAQDTNFVIFDALRDVLGWSVMRTRSELDSVHTAVVTAGTFGDAARTCFEDSYLSRHPADDLLDFNSAARMLVQRKEFQRALRMYLRCVALDPMDLEMRYRVGEVAIDCGYYDLAIEHLLRGYELDEEPAYDFDFQLGRAHSLAGNHQTAIDWYERSLVREDHPVTHTNLGVLHAHFRRFGAAYRAFKRAQALDPSYERARDRILLLKEQLWEEQVARFEYEVSPAAAEPAPDGTGG